MPDPKKQASDTTRLKSDIDDEKRQRADAIKKRDKARADSSSNDIVAGLMNGEGGFYGDTPAKLKAAAARQGASARSADSTIANTAASIGAKADSLNKARQLKAKRK